MATKVIIPLSTEARIALVAAAAVKLGNDTKPGYITRLMDTASELLLLAGEGGKVAKRLDLVNNAGNFSGTVTGAALENSSSRVVVTIKSNTKKVIKGLPEGYEQVRTDRTDSSVKALEMGRYARDLIGHKVYVTIIHEPMTTGDMDVRVMVAIRDAGVSDDQSALIDIAASAKAA